jgi:hypothetical protein
VSVTAAGTRYLERSRARRTAWLAARLGELQPQQAAQLANAIDLLEAIIGEPECRPDQAARRER